MACPASRRRPRCRLSSGTPPTTTPRAARKRSRPTFLLRPNNRAPSVAYLLPVRNPPETGSAPQSEAMLNAPERNRSVLVHERGDRSLDGIFRLIEAAGQPRPLADVLAQMCADVAAIAAADVV